MALTNWKNLPDTSTPVNATNLNDSFEYLDNQVTAENFISKVTFNESAVQSHCLFKKVGKIIIISYQGESKAHSASELIFTLPSGYRPSDSIYVPFVSSNNAYGHLQITSGGLVTVNQISNTTSTGRLYFNFSYTID